LIDNKIQAADTITANSGFSREWIERLLSVNLGSSDPIQPKLLEFKRPDYNEASVPHCRQHPYPTEGRRRHPRLYARQADRRDAAPRNAADKGEEEASEEGATVIYRFGLVLLLVTALGIFAVASAQNKGTTAPAKDAPVLKIAVFSDGRLTVEGKPASLEQLKEMLRKLAEHQGVVWYYREASQHDPPPIVLEVLKEVVSFRLPIRLSTKPDYSDSAAPPTAK
jgi:hypothetical protein